MWSIYVCLVSLVALSGAVFVRDFLRASDVLQGVEVLERVDFRSYEERVWAEEAEGVEIFAGWDTGSAELRSSRRRRLR
jgi:hypothetical protein